jgi:hypothetical protein
MYHHIVATQLQLHYITVHRYHVIYHIKKICFVSGWDRKGIQKT